MGEVYNTPPPGRQGAATPFHAQAFRARRFLLITQTLDAMLFERVIDKGIQ